MNQGIPTNLQQILAALREARNKLEGYEKRFDEPIALIGMDCRFPVANSPAELWQLLHNGIDAITEIPRDRWDVDAHYHPDPDALGKMYTRQMGFVEGVDRFDAQFFGISPREAKFMDPQQRLLLEVSWSVLEHAGYSPETLRLSATGVFVGMEASNYAMLNALHGHLLIDQYALLGSLDSIAVGRIAYVLGLQGPVLQLDTACSSSLVALHLACQSLRNGETNMALAGGVHLNLTPDETIGLCRTKALSPDGRCKTFDSRADGFARGEGCGIVVLKRLSDALADGDNILAVIRGSAVNHDGPSSNLTVPNQSAQESLLRLALKNARVQPHEVQYVEAHGTGTALGDPIEVNALTSVFGGRSDPLWVGSVKTNVGHLEAAAGVAGLIKVVLALQQGEIPPHLHFHTPNPLIDWDATPVRVVTASRPWADGRRIAGLSSFGFSGTNAHIVIEAWDGGEAGEQREEPAVPDRGRHILALSAKSEAALKAVCQRYQAFFNEQPTVNLADVCHTANTGRSHFAHRVAIVAQDAGQIQSQLADFATGIVQPGMSLGHAPDHLARPKIAFLFTGQGSQYVDMGRELYQTQPVFRRALDRCDAILRPLLGESLLALLYPAPPHLNSNVVGLTPHPQGEGTLLQLDQTAYAQPALFALEYALAELWKSWGVEADVVLGHSVGEYVAACVSGVLAWRTA